MTQIIEAWDIQRWDGGGGSNHECYIASEEEAALYLANSPHDRYYKKTFIIHETAQQAREFKQGEAKKRALAKLTKEERAALGFS